MSAKYPNRTTAVLVNGKNEVSCGEVAVPDPGPGEVLTQTLFTCVSPGTELRCLALKQANVPPLPFIPGYANVGRVIGAGEGVDVPLDTIVLHAGTSKADCSLGWGGHCGLAVVDAASAIVLPEGVDPLDAAPTVLQAIAYHGVRLANARPDETVACIGLGPVGMYAALEYTLTGARVAAFDLRPERIELARSLGLDAFPVEASLPETVERQLPDGADVVVDSTGAAAVLPDSLRILRVPEWNVTLRDLPRLVIQGSYAGGFELPYQETFAREAVILTPRNHTRFDDLAVLGLNQRGKLPPATKLAEVHKPHDAPAVYRTLRDEPAKMMTAIFDWSENN